ncbi:MAG: hypothetical protein H6581_01760 [Bacteroidia bacterium]|nr:hypothetical protein [Bacteroidia bacterium]
MNKEQYHHFLESLYALKDSGQDREAILNSGHFQMVISGIQSIKEDQIKTLSQDLVGIPPDKIEADLKTLFDPVFNDTSNGFLFALNPGIYSLPRGFFT